MALPPACRYGPPAANPLGCHPDPHRTRIVTSRTHVLLWTNSTAAYLDAI
jgi:hypothetical protein